MADDLDVGARGARAQFALLPVHIGADPRTGEAADAGADDLLGPVAPPADEIAEQIAAERAADAADRGLGDALLAGLRIGGAGGGGDQRGEACGGQELGIRFMAILPNAAPMNSGGWRALVPLAN